jgi:hypothetical protein
VFIISWVRNLASVHSFIPFNFPVHTHFYTVTVFPSFIAGSYVVSYITAIDFFFQERYAYSVYSGTHDQRAVPGGDQLTNTHLAALLTNPIE